jgi:prolyl oligopeptidase
MIRIATTTFALAMVTACAGGVHPAADAPSSAGGPAAEPSMLPPHDADDPFLWLEEVEGERAMAWVEERNARTLAQLAEHPTYQPIFQRSREILDSRDRIPFPSILGDRLYNFWQDADNPRGVWRRTTWESYFSGAPAWETVIDVDRLARDEGVNWSYGGATCLEPEYRRCLVRLSRGGADAVEVREFDLERRAFVDGGFRLPEAKQSVTWYDEDALLVAGDFGPGSMTTSGYARTARLWRRGTPLSEARTLFEGRESDVSVSVGAWRTADRALRFVRHAPSFFQSSIHLIRDDDSLEQIEIPMDASPTLFRDRMIVRLRSDWEVGGRTFPGGSLIHISFDRFAEGARDFQVMLQPGERESVRSVVATRDHLLVGMLDNVQGELRRYGYTDGAWTYENVPAPAMGSIGVAAASPYENRYFFTYSGYTQPSTLYVSNDDGSVREVRRMPEMFDAAGLIVEQHEASSADGTRVPYFVVRRKSAQMDGTNPTLLYAYGGFEVAQTPGYSAIAGSAWLERGGVYVVANIRGGGEFGPEWHRSALRENRQRAFDDFLAVAEDLVRRGISRPEHLGIMGGSNGGLLVGAALTQRPDLFNAVVIQVPLLDMRRYHMLLAGASWMEEYGDPDDPEQWAYIGRYSPYQNVRADVEYPAVLFTTTTRDDRVHPGHARKMAALLESHGNRVYYFENTEGGHGAGVTSEQRARTQAVTWAYLWQQLGGAAQAAR